MFRHDIILPKFYIALVFIWVGTVSAQKKVADVRDVSFIEDNHYLITLKDKSKILGVYVNRVGDVFEFQSNSLSKLSAHKDDIQLIRKVGADEVNSDGIYIPRNIHFNRYFFGQTAYNISKHDMNITSNLGVHTSFEYGVTDHLSLAGGTNLFSWLDSEFSTLNILSAKVGGYKFSKGVTLGVTGFYGFYDDERHKMISGLITGGNKDVNFTIGLGAYISTGEEYFYNPITFRGEYRDAVFRSSLLTFSGMARLSRYTYFITENWLTSEMDYHEDILSVGFRFAGRNLSFDVALMYLVYEEYYNPYLGLSYKF